MTKLAQAVFWSAKHLNWIEGFIGAVFLCHKRSVMLCCPLTVILSLLACRCSSILALGLTYPLLYFIWINIYVYSTYLLLIQYNLYIQNAYYMLARLRGLPYWSSSMHALALLESQKLLFHRAICLWALLSCRMAWCGLLSYFAVATH